MSKPITIETPIQPADVAPPPLSAIQPVEQARSTSWTLVRDRSLLGLLLLIALAQGTLFMLLVPPWQHYDEPTHFEYAWLIANRTPFPAPGDEDNAMRRDLAASMLTHKFFWNLPRPLLLTDKSPWIGITELGHPPVYYMLASLPLRAVRHLDVTSQLYVARTVSLLLFVLTIAVAFGLVRDLTAPGHLLRWAVPLAVMLVPPFVDLMTAVNNDAGAVCIFSLFLWGAVRAICFGPTWPRLVWISLTALLAAATKNTASLALLLAPIALMAAVWVRYGWRWRWLLVSAIAGSALLLGLALEWGDAAYWYRWSSGPSQTSPTQVAIRTAPVGQRALLLEASPESKIRQLISPLMPEDIRHMAGAIVTVGGWMWADRPVRVNAPSLVLNSEDGNSFIRSSQTITVTTTPVFVSQIVQVPEDIYLLQYAIGIDAPPDDQLLHLFLDGAVVAEGSFPADQPPAFDDPAARSGVWDGRHFVNLVRNASAEQSWPHLRPWLDQTLYHYIHRSPSQTVAALFDIQRNGPFLITNIGPWIIYAFFGVFGWAHVRLEAPAWPYLFLGLAVVTLGGVARWLVRRPMSARLPIQTTLFFLGLTFILIWMNTVLRPLPMLDPKVYYPVARYGFPSIIPATLALVGGWWALWPRHLRTYAVALLIIGLLALNLISVATIQSFYEAISIS